MKYVAAAFLFATTTASAEMLTGEAFDQLSRGTTMHFTANGFPYGSEQFFSDRRTVWRADDGRCVNGKWSYKAPEICFIYDDGSGPFCWMITLEAGTMQVTSANADEGEAPLVLELSGQDKQPIYCTGPLFGV